MIRHKFPRAAAVALATGFAFTSAAVLGRQAVPRQEAAEARAAVAPPGPPAAPPAGWAPATGRPDVRYLVLPGGADDRRDRDPKTLQLLAKLEEPISMSFANETPLDDVLKYIKQATTSPTYNGIPIYVDPVGMQDAERSSNSTIAIDLEGVPLRRTLQLILAQLGLAYFVEDGIVVITSEDLAREPLPPSIAAPAPIFKMVQKSERGELTSGELKELIEVMRLRRTVRLMHEGHESAYGGDGAGFGGSGPRFPGEEEVAEIKELRKEVRELIGLLKAEKQPEKKEKKSAEAK